MTDKPEVPEKVYISPHDIKMILKQSTNYANIIATCDTDRKGKTGIEFIPAESLKELREIWEKKEKDGWLEQYQLELWKILDNLAKKMGWPRLVSNETKDDGVKNE